MSARVVTLEADVSEEEDVVDVVLVDVVRDVWEVEEREVVDVEDMLDASV